MSRRTVLTLAALGLMTACAQQDAARPPAMAWSLSQTPEEGAKLAFGEPYSDHLLVMMSCEPGSGQIRLARTAAPGAAPAIVLASNGEQARYRGEATPFGAGVYIEAAAAVDDPALTAFRRTRSLALRDGETRAALPATPAGRARIKAFFKACERA